MGINRLHLAMVPTTDPDRAIAFYERLGFEKRADAPFGDGERWVELNPPQGTAGVALVPAAPGDATPRAGIIVAADDLDATHANVLAADLDADAVIARPGGQDAVRIGAATVVGPTPAMFTVRDPDGNVVLVVGD